MILILCGNTCYPIMLRALLRFAYCVCGLRWSDGRFYRVLGLLLHFPRTCYTHLFPNYATRWLAIVTPALVAMQFLALCVIDLWAKPARQGHSAIMTGLTLRERVLAIAFQSV